MLFLKRSMGLPSAMLLLLLALLSGSLAGRPLIKIGWTLPESGVNAEISASYKIVFSFWENFTNSHGGINVGGVAHDVHIISYNDASDAALIPVLYEHLIRNDNVDFLLGPQVNFPVAAALAQQYEIPLINIGDFEYYTIQGAPNGSFGGWVFSAQPNPFSGWTACDEVLHDLGVQTMSSMWGETTTNIGFPDQSNYWAKQFGITPLEPHFVIKDDLSNVTKAVLAVKKQNADVVVAAMYNPVDSATMLNAIRYNRLSPKALLIVIGISVNKFRKLAGWQAEHVFGPSAWDAVLNFTDSDFGDSIGFYDAFVNGTGLEPSSGDVLNIYGVTALKHAIEAAGTLNTTEVKQALQNLNVMTFFGPANFSGPHQQTLQEWYCMQSDRNGNIRPVSKNAPTPVIAIYNSPVAAPPGFYRSPPKSNTKWIIIGTLLPFFLLVVACALAYYVLHVKFAIEKSEMTRGESW